MASEFQGLFVKFGANTVEFEKSVKGINSALTGLKKDFQNISRQLKFDPSNVDLYNAKLANLEEQARVGALKIAELKAQQEKLGKSEVGSSQWNKLQLEINKVELQMQSVDKAIKATKSTMSTLGVNSALAKLEQEASNLQSELDIVNRKLRLDPKNPQLVAEKFELIGQQVKNAQNRVDVLKSKQQALGQDKIGTQEWKNLDRAIGNAEADVQELTSSYNKFKVNKITGSIKEMDELDGKVQKTESSLKTASVALGTFIGNMASNVANKAIGVITGSIGDMVKRSDTLSTANRNFQNMGFSADETSKMMKNLDKSISGLPTPMNEAVQGVQLMASATGDLSGGQKIFTALNNAILGFGGSAEDVSGATMQLAQDLSTGTITAGTFNSMINANMGPALTDIAKKMGLKGGAGELKQQLSEGTITAKQFTDTMVDLNKTGLDGKASFETMAKDGTKTLSTQLANMKTAVVRGGANVVQALTPALMPIFADIQQTIGEVATDLKNFFSSADGKELIKTMQQIGKSIVENVKKGFELLKDVIVVVYPIMKEFFKFVSKNKDVLTALAVVFGVLAGVVGIYTAITTAATIVTGAFKTILDSMGIGLLITAIVAVIAGLVYFFTQTKKGKEIWKSFTDFLVKAWDTVKNFFAGLGKWFSDVWNGIVTTTKGIWDKIKNAFSDGIKGIISFVKNNWGLILAPFTGGLSELVKLVIDNWDSIKKAFSSAFNVIKNTASTAWNGITGFFTTVWDGIKNIFSTALNFIVDNIVKPVFSGISNVIQTVFVPISKVFQVVLDVIKNIFIIVFGGILLIILSAVNGFLDAFSRFIDNTKLLFNALATFFKTVWNTIKAVFETVVSAIVKFVTNTFNNVKNTITNIWNAVATFFKNVWNAIYNALKPIVTAIYNYISSTFNSVKNTVTSIFNAVASFVSSVWNAIKNTISSVASAIGNVVSSAFNAVRNTVINIFNGISSFVVSIWTAIKNSVSTLANQVIGVVSSAFNAVRNTVINIFNGISSFTVSIWNAIKNSIGALIAPIVNIVSNTFNAVSNAVNGIVNHMAYIVSGAWDNIKIFFSNGVNTILSTVSGIAGRIANSFNNLVGTIWSRIGDVGSIGRNIIDGIVGGLGNLAGRIADAISNAISQAKGSIGNIASKIFKSDGGMSFGEFGGAVGGMYKLKAYGDSLPLIQSSASATTNLNINVQSNNSNGLELARVIERQIVRRLSR